MVRGRISSSALAALFLAYGSDVERRRDAGGSFAAVVLGEDPRAARRLVVRGLHGRVRHVRDVLDEVLFRARACRLRRRLADSAMARRRIRTTPSRGRRPARCAMDTPNIAAAAGRKYAAQWFNGNAELAQIDVLIYRVVAVGLPLLTLGIITGAMWAHEAWGAYWQWDPKETAALFSWIVYAIYMHLHTRSAWRGRAHRVDQRRRIPDDHVLLFRRQHVDQRPAQLQGVDGGLKSAPRARYRRLAIVTARKSDERRRLLRRRASVESVMKDHGLSSQPSGARSFVESRASLLRARGAFPNYKRLRGRRKPRGDYAPHVHGQRHDTIGGFIGLAWRFRSSARWFPTSAAAAQPGRRSTKQAGSNCKPRPTRP